MIRRKKFREDQEGRISDSMLEKTKIVELLNGKGEAVFIPDGKWRGIQGLEELYPNGLELNWREEIKDFRSSCRARPINPKLYQAVKDEFQRLRGYQPGAPLIAFWLFNHLIFICLKGVFIGFLISKCTILMSRLKLIILVFYVWCSYIIES